MIKIVFFDIDGTLIDIGAKGMSPKTKKTLLALKERGIKICVATGRAPLSLPDFDGVEFDAYLTFNGAYCYDRQGEIFSNPIEEKDVVKVIDNCTRMGRPVSLATRTRLVSNGRDDDLSDYYTNACLELTVAEDFEEAVHEQVYQIMMGCRREDHEAIIAGADGVRITAWWHRAADVIPADGGKGTAVAKVLEHYGLTRAEAMAFGDGNNDIEMLETVGAGVAMGNGSDRLKEIADDVCGRVDEDGIFHYCQQQGLI